MANFIWIKNMHAWSWNSICKPKSEGGLGIRKIQDINKSAGLKLFWRCFTSQSNWSIWMRDVYCRQSSPWNIQAHLMDSGTWKFLVSVKNIAHNHIDIQQNSLSYNIDTWIRCPTYSGKFTFQTAWNISRTPSPKFDLAKVVWCHHISPKMALCLLRALSDRLYWLSTDWNNLILLIQICVFFVICTLRQ